MSDSCVIRPWFLELLRASSEVHGDSYVALAWFVGVWFVCGVCVVRGWFMRGSLVVHA